MLEKILPHIVPILAALFGGASTFLFYRPKLKKANSDASAQQYKDFSEITEKYMNQVAGLSGEIGELRKQLQEKNDQILALTSLSKEREAHIEKLENRIEILEKSLKK